MRNSVGRVVNRARLEHATPAWYHMLESIGFLILVLSIPFEGQGWDVGITLNLALLGGIIFVLFSPRLILRHKLDHSDHLFAGFILVALLSILVNAFFPMPSEVPGSVRLRWSPARPFIHLSRFVLLFLLYIAAKEYLVVHRNGIARFYRYFHVIALFTLGYGTYQLIGGFMGWPLLSLNNLHDAGHVYRIRFFPKDMVRVFATFWEPKYYGQFLLAATFLLAGSYLSRRHRYSCPVLSSLRRPALIEFIVIVGLIFHLMLSFSRASFIIFVPMLALAGILQRRFSNVFSIAFLWVLAIWVVLGVVVGENLGSGIQTIVWSYTSERGTLNFYIVRTRAVVEGILARPILGYGLGALEFYTSSLVHQLPAWAKTEFVSAPDMLSYLLSGTGVVGTLFFMLFLFSVFRRAWKRMRVMRRGSSGIRGMSTRTLLVFSFCGVLAVWMQFTVMASWNEVYVFLLLALLDALVGASGAKQRSRNEGYSNAQGSSLK